MRKIKTEKQKTKLTEVAELSATTIDPSRFPDIGQRYKLLAFISQGGMGTIFKARDSETGATRAVKVLNQELSNDREAIKRFEQEVDAISQLSHPNLITVYDHGETKDGIPYLVTDFVEGETLSEYLKNNDASLGEEFDMLDLFIQLCEVLSLAHEKGVIHRDIKPGNVILSKTADGGTIVKLVDFGIAKIMPSASSQSRETHSLTLTGGTFGTPSYMSPEQCLGFKLDERSDIYSLGCLMYEVATGHPPFSGENPIQIVVSHIEKVPPLWSKKKQHLPGLESVVFKCLEKDKEERYQSVQQLLTDLGRLSAGEKVTVETKVREPAPVYSRSDIFSRAGELFLYGLYILMLLFGQTETALTVACFLPAFIQGHLKNFGRPGSGRAISKQWPFLLSVLRIALGATGLLVCFCNLGFFEFLPQNLQVFCIGLIWLHVGIAIACAVACIGVFFFGRETGQSRNKILVRYFSMLVPCLVLAALCIPSSTFSSTLMCSIYQGTYSTRSIEANPKLKVELIKTSLLFNPGNRVILDDLTGYLNQLGRYEESVAILTRAIAEAGSDNRLVRELLPLRAIAFGKMGQFDKAFADIDKAYSIEKEPTMDGFGSSDAPLHEALGDIYLYKKDYQKAIREFTTAEKGKGDYLTSYFSANGSVAENLAIARYRVGDTKGSIQSISTLCKNSISSSATEFFLKRALLYEIAGDKKLALADYTTAKGMLEKLGDEGRNPIIERVQNIVPQRFSSHMHLEDLARAYVYTKLGDKEKAAKFLELAEVGGYKKSDLLAFFSQSLGVEGLKW